MKILVACEFSGVVRDAFTAKGHYAISCDLLPSESSLAGEHYQGDVRDILYDGWDMMIAFPPCTHLASSGARWFKDKKDLQEESLRFVKELMDAPIDKICIENPIGVISTRIRKPDQIIQPYMFGHNAKKSTCLWLKNLPKLVPTNVVDEGDFFITSKGKKFSRFYYLPETKNRWKLRSKTFEGIALAMADQWSECAYSE